MSVNKTFGINDEAVNLVRSILEKKKVETVEDMIDEAKSKEQQIADLERILKSTFGNTSAVRMKKYAIQKKIDKLKSESIEEKKMDPVDKKELKGKFKDREDKDIDNDGDVDDSDKYLHKRRKAVKKSVAKDKKEVSKDEIDTEPKMDDEISEMRGASAGLRKTKTFPLRSKSAAEKFAKERNGKLTTKGQTIYVTYDLPEEVDLDEATKTFKTLEDWVMAVVNAGGSVSKRGNTLSATGLSRTQSATWELKKGRGSMLESVELDENKKVQESKIKLGSTVQSLGKDKMKGKVVGFNTKGDVTKVIIKSQDGKRYQTSPENVEVV